MEDLLRDRDGFSHCEGHAACQRPHYRHRPVDAHKRSGGVDSLYRVHAGVLLNNLDLSAVYASGIVDVLGSQIDRVEVCFAKVGEGAREGV